jgi:hypothetical protein
MMSAGFLHPAGTGARSPNAISGSILGATLPRSESVALPPCARISVLS